MFGAPKAGKTWLCLQLAHSIATGAPFLGYQTHRHGTLMLSLEDSQRRIERRENMLFDGATDISNLFALTMNEIPPLESTQALLDMLDATLQAYAAADIRLIIVDVLELILGLDGRNQGQKEGSYSALYRQLTPLKRWADARGVTILGTGHTRKANGYTGGTAFDNILGSQAYRAASDSIWIIDTRDTEKEPIFVTESRDVESRQFYMKHSPDSGRWTRLETEIAGRDGMTPRARHNSKPVVITIQRLVAEGGGQWTGTATEFLRACKKYTGTPTQIDKKAAMTVSRQIRAVAPDIELYDGVTYVYQRGPRTTGPGKHTFTRLEPQAHSDE